MRAARVSALPSPLRRRPDFDLRAWPPCPTAQKRPDFTTQASLAGKPFSFSLAEALKQGPVVLYFYPAAFTSGCTSEAHNFAEATEQFKALGATVIGVSHDDIDTLNRFSVSECREQVRASPPSGPEDHEGVRRGARGKPEWAKRTSYVIAPTGEILYAYTALNPDKHVANTMAAVQKWAEDHKAKTAS